MPEMRRVSTIDRSLSLEIGFAGDMSPAGLTDAIIEALEHGGIINEAGITYIRASALGERLHAVDIWAPEPVEEVEPPEIPVAPEDGQPEPN